MDCIDIITIATAIIGAILGIINLILNIHSRMKEKIKIYTDVISLTACFDKEEYCIKGDYCVIESDCGYRIKVLNNKNRAVVVENICLYIKNIKNEVYFDSNVDYFKMKSYNVLIPQHDMKLFVDDGEIVIFVNKRHISKGSDKTFWASGKVKVKIDGKIYKGNVRICMVVCS